MTRSISFRWDPEFVRRIDAARGDVPRSVWVRRAVERALDGTAMAKSDNPGPDRVRSPGDPAPAEQPYRQHVSGPNVENIRSSDQSKRDVRPIPKRGK